MAMPREEEKDTPQAKISPMFAARFEQLGPEEKVRAIVMLEAGNARRILKKRPAKMTRRAAVNKIRRSVTEVLPDIDRILERHSGRRLKSKIDTLGAVPVVTTPAGINALTASEHVKAIFEDQAISRIA